MKKLTVISSNPNSKGGFVTKLQTVSKVETIFGTKEKKETYYVSGTKQMEIGVDVEVNMNMFLVQEHPMINPETKAEFQAKWLHLA